MLVFSTNLSIMSKRNHIIGRHSHKLTTNNWKSHLLIMIKDALTVIVNKRSFRILKGERKEGGKNLQ